MPGKHYNRIASLLLLLLALNPLFAGDVHYPTDIAKIKERDTLIVAQFGGIRAGFFDYDDSGKIADKAHYLHNGRKMVGYDIDLAIDIARELDVELKIDRGYESFNAVAYAVANGEADMAISKLSITTERSQFLNYTPPYLSLRMAVLINRMSESRIGTNKEDELYACKRPGVKIGVLDKSSFVDHGKRMFPDAELQFFPDQESLFQAALNGEILALFYEEYEIGKYIRKRPDLPIYCHMVELPGKRDDIAIAVNSHSVTLLGFLNTYMEKESIGKSVAYILDNYIPEEELETTYEKTSLSLADPKIFISIFMSLLMAALWISFGLRRGVKEKEVLNG